MSSVARKIKITASGPLQRKRPSNQFEACWISLLDVSTLVNSINETAGV
jgi:hypothetical protein